MLLLVPSETSKPWSHMCNVHLTMECCCAYPTVCFALDNTLRLHCHGVIYSLSFRPEPSGKSGAAFQIGNNH